MKNEEYIGLEAMQKALHNWAFLLNERLKTTGLEKPRLTNVWRTFYEYMVRWDGEHLVLTNGHEEPDSKTTLTANLDTLEGVQKLNPSELRMLADKARDIEASLFSRVEELGKHVVGHGFAEDIAKLPKAKPVVEFLGARRRFSYLDAVAILALLSVGGCAMYLCIYMLVTMLGAHA